MSVPDKSGDPSGRSSRFRRAAAVLLAALVLIAGALAGVWWIAKQRAAHARAEWKGPTLERLAGLSITNEDIGQELDELKAGPRPNIDFGWAHDQVLLMTNGEYIIYAFRHGANNGFVDHLFLGHGSDGRWLYSTSGFHHRVRGEIFGRRVRWKVGRLFAAHMATNEIEDMAEPCAPPNRRQALQFRCVGFRTLDSQPVPASGGGR